MHKLKEGIEREEKSSPLPRGTVVRLHKHPYRYFYHWGTRVSMELDAPFGIVVYGDGIGLVKVVYYCTINKRWKSTWPAWNEYNVVSLDRSASQKKKRELWSWLITHATFNKKIGSWDFYLSDKGYDVGHIAD